MDLIYIRFTRSTQEESVGMFQTQQVILLAMFGTMDESLDEPLASSMVVVHYQMYGYDSWCIRFIKSRGFFLLIPALLDVFYISRVLTFTFSC